MYNSVANFLFFFLNGQMIEGKKNIVWDACSWGYEWKLKIKILKNKKWKEGGGGGGEGEEENTDHVTNTILSFDFLGQNLTPFLKNKIIGKILGESVFSLM